MQFRGVCNMSGDKSIAHRALILSSWFKGVHIINNFPESEDILTTLDILEMYGLQYRIKSNSIRIDSTNVNFKKQKINCNSSGTSARLLCGYLTGANIETKILGSSRLSDRPMDRVVVPLNSFGGNIKSTGSGLPIYITPSSKLRSFHYNLKIPSAQVKSCLIFYAMFMVGTSSISGQIHTRDHLENLLSYFNYPINYKNGTINIQGNQRIFKNLNIKLAGDISSASFIIAGAILLKGSSIKLKNICFNKYRTGFIKKIIEMGANIEFHNKKNIYGERVVDIIAKYSPNLVGVNVNEQEIPALIDEVPILSVVASHAKGETVIKGVDELKIKESNRVKAIIVNINNMGGSARVSQDKLIITPKNKLYNTGIKSFKDHRIFMAFYIANLVSGERFNSQPVDFCYKKSFINFFDILGKVIK